MTTEFRDTDFSPWVPILRSAAKPARLPHFRELTPDGQWNDWSPDPEVSDVEPSFVEQPAWTTIIKPIGDSGRFTWELCPGGLHREALAGKTIRLLDAKDAHFSEGVLQGFRLVTFPLADAPSFDALSYCWGDMRLCTGILFDTGEGPDLVERMFRVTEDLATCLVSILTTESLAEKPRYLWVDQICINQEDIVERNQQVSFMAGIYETARQVLVWLGQKSEFTIEDAKIPEHPPADTDLNGQSFLDWILSTSVFARPWFFRLWTIQEVVLAKQIQVVIGEECLSWDDLFEQSRALDDFISGTMLNVIMKDITRNLNWLIVGSIGRCRRQLAHSGSVDSEVWLPLIIGSQRCRNPLDKVYALIGLGYRYTHGQAGQSQPPEKSAQRNFDIGAKLPDDFIDYRKSLGTVFRDFALLIIQSRKSLNYLAYYEHDTTFWFPQFSSSATNFSSGLMGAVGNRGQYAACAGRKHVYVSPPIDSQWLDVKGNLVASIAVEITEMNATFSGILHNAAEEINLSELCRRCWPHMASAYAKSGEDEWDTGFIIDMIDVIFCQESDFHRRAPVTFDGRRMLEMYCMICTLLELTNLPAPLHEIELTEIERRSLSVGLSRGYFFAMGRKLVVLESGHLALVQKEARKGDEVAILHGLDVPCVLSRLEDGDEWRWLGDSFVLGLMRGEAVNWDEEDATTFTLA